MIRVFVDYRNDLFDGDMVLLSAQDQRLQARGHDWQRAFYIPTQTDAGVVAFREWLDLVGGMASMWPDHVPSSPSPVPKQQLLDRYEQHVQHCSSCRTMAAAIDPLLNVLGFVTAVLLVQGGVGIGWGPTLLVTLVTGSAALALLAFRKGFYFKDYDHWAK